jgi:anaerobic magnesium-protoporphyrin IX monomethyl ester cyclase
MNIMLLYPRFQWSEMGQMQEPLGLLYIAAVLRQHGFGVKLFDLTYEKNADRLEAELKGVDAVGLTTSSVLFSRAKYLLGLIKEKHPNLPVIAGGPHPTADPEGTLRAGFDFAVAGEGEQTAVELFTALAEHKPVKGIPGVWMMEGDQVYQPPARQMLADINELPFPARDLIDYKQYLANGMIQVGVCLSRGCPFQCKFCKPMQDMLFGRKLRKRAPEKVAEEIAQAVALTGHNFFLFRDDSLASLGGKWVSVFRQEMEKRKVNIRFSGQTRVSELTEEIVTDLKSIGLVGLAFGVESGSQKIIDYYNKKFKVEDSVKAFELCDRLNIGTHCFIILGAPDETKEDLQMTIDLVKRIKPKSVTISRLTPAPGTYLHSETIAQGILKPVEWEHWDFYKNQSPLKLNYLTDEDLMAAENEIRELVPGSVLYPRAQIHTCSEIISGQ